MLISVFVRYIFTGVYLLIVQYLTKIGGQVGIALTKSEHLVSKEAAANSMIYKVRFIIYFYFFSSQTCTSDYMLHCLLAMCVLLIVFNCESCLAGVWFIFFSIVYWSILSSHTAQRL